MTEPVARATNDSRRAGRDPCIVASVRLLISDIQRSVAPAVAEARFFERWSATCAEDAESPAERCRRENTEGLRVIAVLGNVRGAALKAARRAYPNNPNEHHRLAQRFRRLLRQQK
jgi:hypothetical protein